MDLFIRRSLFVNNFIYIVIAIKAYKINQFHLL